MGKLFWILCAITASLFFGAYLLASDARPDSGTAVKVLVIIGLLFSGLVIWRVAFVNKRRILGHGTPLEKICFAATPVDVLVDSLAEVDFGLIPTKVLYSLRYRCVDNETYIKFFEKRINDEIEIRESVE